LQKSKIGNQKQSIETSINYQTIRGAKHNIKFQIQVIVELQQLKYKILIYMKSTKHWIKIGRMI